MRRIETSFTLGIFESWSKNARRTRDIRLSAQPLQPGHLSIAPALSSFPSHTSDAPTHDGSVRHTNTFCQCSAT